MAPEVGTAPDSGPPRTVPGAAPPDPRPGQDRPRSRRRTPRSPRSLRDMDVIIGRRGRGQLDQPLLAGLLDPHRRGRVARLPGRGLTSLFLAIFYIATYDRLGRLAAVDRTVTVAVTTAMLHRADPARLAGHSTCWSRASRPYAGFFAHNQSGVTADRAGHGRRRAARHRRDARAGGPGPADLVPLGVSAPSSSTRAARGCVAPVRIFVDAMSGMPSIVSGLFIYATLIIPLAKDSSLCSASTASWRPWRCR